MVVQELFAKMGLTLDTASFIKASLAVEGIKKGLEILGEKLHEAAEGFFEIFKGTAEYSEQIHNMSVSTGLSTDMLQELRYAAGVTGISFEELAMGTKFLAVNMAKAAEGNGEAGKAFAALGVKVTNSDGSLRDVGETFDDVTLKLSEMEEGAKKTRLATELFGKGGYRLLPMLQKGAEGLAEVRAEAHELGLVLTEDELHQGEEFERNLKKITFASEGLRNMIAGPLMEDLKNMAIEMVGWAKANREWLKTKIHDVMTGLGRALRFAWATAKLLRNAFGVVGTVVGWVANRAKMFSAVIAVTLAGAMLTNIGYLVTTALWYAVVAARATAAGVAMAASWLRAAAPGIAIVTIILLLVGMVQDLYTSITEGDGVFADFWAAIWDSDSMWAVRQFFAGLVTWAKDAIVTVKSFFTDLWAWMTAGFKAVVTAIPGWQWAMDKFSGTGTAPTASPASALPSPAIFGGGAASPGASAATSSSVSNANRSVNYAPSIVAPMTFNMPAGSSPQDTGRSVQGYLEELNTRQLREAMPAVAR